jgi:hypothetical protein
VRCRSTAGHPHTRGDRDHPRNAPNTRRSATAPTSRPTRAMVPSGNVISMVSSTAACLREGAADGTAGRGHRGRGRVGAYLHRQERRRICCPEFTAARLAPPVPEQATAHVIPPRNLDEAGAGRPASATIRNFSSSRQRRRRSTPVMISTAQPAPVLNSVLTSISEVRPGIHRCKAAAAGGIRNTSTHPGSCHWPIPAIAWWPGTGTTTRSARADHRDT